MNFVKKIRYCSTVKSVVNNIKEKMPIEPILLIHGGAGNITDARITRKLSAMRTIVRCAFKHLVHDNNAQDNKAPDNNAPDNETADNNAPDYKALDNNAPDNNAPDNNAPDNKATDNNAPDNKAPEKKNNALLAVEAAVNAMELDENFNAGYGSCLNLNGECEVEASIMEGANLKAGCVTLLRDIMHPVSVARTVMENTNHTFLGGEAAQQFAICHGFEELPAGSLVTESACLALEEFKNKQAKGVDTTYATTELDVRPGETGTVGAVAIDTNGNIAVATSTGGITGKIPGRIGDTPLLGCGTYADNLVGGVSTTGHGETIMRYNLAQKILAKIKYENKTAQQATEEACKEMTQRLTGTGGAITIDAKGDIGVYWTSHRMAWACIKKESITYGMDLGMHFIEPLQVNDFQ